MGRDEVQFASHTRCSVEIGFLEGRSYTITTGWRNSGPCSALPKTVDVDLRATIRESLLQASSMAERAGLTLSSARAGEAPIQMQADPVRLKQVVDNLLSNAIKYTRAGGAVKVSALDLGTTVEIAVQDTGIGLSAEQLERIFLPFERLGAERTATARSGLGPALTKSFVELMGATVRVSSHPGVGSAFVVTLPSGRE